MRNPITAFLAGTATGVLSGMGLGGGSLLLIYLTAFAGMEQHLAQGINLLYFLPSAASALPSHWKHSYIRRDVLLPAVSTGLTMSALAAWLATSLDARLLRKCFNLFLLYIGLRELFRKTPPKKD